MRSKMRKLRIALGSNDGENIFLGHMGMAESFYLYDLFDDGNSNFVGKRKNTSPEVEGKHGLLEKMKAVMAIINDADVIIGRKMSPNFLKISANTGIQAVVVKSDSLSLIIDTVMKSFDRIYNLVKWRKAGDRPKEIPELKE